MYETGAWQGFGVIALRDRIRTRITEHEIDHAFGLSHVKGNTPAVRKRVMWEGSAGFSKGYGKTLTATECATIQANMAKFACK